MIGIMSGKLRVMIGIISTFTIAQFFPKDASLLTILTKIPPHAHSVGEDQIIIIVLGGWVRAKPRLAERGSRECHTRG
jgi:DeoR/GlpR family transcriptional regulator of sugar metabolism